MSEQADPKPPTCPRCQNQRLIPREPGALPAVVTCPKCEGVGPVAKPQGYEFQVKIGDRSEWVRLQGNGGLLGDGCIYDGCAVGPEVEAQLLKQAKRNLRRDGSLTRLTGVEFPVERRLEMIRPESVAACRAIEVRA